MAESNAVDIDTAIDSQPISVFQILVIGLCAATVVFDGFDNQTIGLLAPSIAKSLNLNVARLGVVFSSGLFGWMIGALVMGSLADRLGRRWLLIASVTFFGVFTLLVTTATTLHQLAVLWLLNGIGLGGTVPNAVSLATEFAPRRAEAKVASWVMTGMPVGAIIGGIASTTLLPSSGWHAVMYFGCALPLSLAVILLFWLPESARFLIAVRADPMRIKRLMRRVTPDIDMDSIDYSSVEEGKAKGVPVLQLFSQDRAVDTVLFWIAFFGNLMILYFVLNWFPTMLHGAGLSLSTAVIATTLFSVGGAAGTIGMGYLMTALGGRRATIGDLVLSALLIGVLATNHSLPWLVWILTALLGAAVQGAQAGLNALVAAYYPTSVRSTGLGWALGIGRTGSIVGPMLGELVLLLHWPLRMIFMFGMVPALIATVSIGFLALRHHRTPREPVAATATAPTNP